LLGYSRAQHLVDDAENAFSENRSRFNQLFDAAERE
jgi:hypothetical protein